MNARLRMAALVVMVGLCLVGMNAIPLAAQGTGTGTSGTGATAPCQYKMPEYNAEQAAAAEKNPTAQLKLLDDFMAKYPTSCLLNYVYPIYYQNYYAQKNFPKVIEYADKQLALGDRLNPTEKYQAYSARMLAYNNITNPDAGQAKAEYQSALDGVKAVDALPKPEGLPDDRFQTEKQKAIYGFLMTAGSGAMTAKMYPEAIQVYKQVLAANQDDFLADYNLGRAYAGMTPPSPLDSLWYYARAATSKNANAQQASSVKTYIPKAIANYQGNTVCDPLTQQETNELLQLASSAADRPATYKLFSAAELSAAQGSMTIASVVTDLKAGGDKSKLTWTAACGLEFPDVPGKVLGVDAPAEGDTITLKLAFVTNDAEFDAAQTPDMEVKMAAPIEPAAGASQQDKEKYQHSKEAFDLTKKIEKDNFIRFTGTLETYDPDPAFMLHWDKAKVNEEDLPKPGKKAPAKKPGAKKP